MPREGALKQLVHSGSHLKMPCQVDALRQLSHAALKRCSDSLTRMMVMASGGWDGRGEQEQGKA